MCIRMKEAAPDVYRAFPESLPKGASYVKWVVGPGFLQAPSFEVLAFRIDREYLEQIVDTYRKEAEIATYDKQYDEWSVDFIHSGLLSEPENTTVYVLYDNGDWNHHHIYGFWVNDRIGEIGFFAE